MHIKLMLALGAATALTACGGSTSSADAASNPAAPTPLTSTAPVPGSSQAPLAPASLNGRLLASNCFQCHGTNGVGGFDRITGGEAKEVYEYRGEVAAEDIMAAHAQGYTDAQLAAIVAYLNQLN